MQAGLLREDICILRPQTITNEYGETAQEYAPAIHCKAHIKRESHREIENQEIVYTDRLEVQIRHYHKISDYDRVCWCGRVYRILSIYPDRLNQSIRLMIEEIHD